jgi:hypothetical protein
MVDWKFARRRDRCTACDAPFQDGARHVSALSVSAEELTREDVCLPCWERRAAGTELFFWYTRRTSDRGGLRLDLATLEQIFLRLEGRDETKMIELRYVLCLLLMRKKRLKLVKLIREPREVLVLRRPRREESLPVVVCDFGPERVEELRCELSAIFDGAESLPAMEDPSGVEEVPPALALAACGVER